MSKPNSLQWALYYLTKLHYSVIPCGHDKKPLIKWEQYQKQLASEQQVKKWWQEHPDANVGIVTGLVSGIAVIDVDTDEGKEAIQQYLPDSLTCPTVQTPKGGQHLYFKLTDPRIRNNARAIEGCDLRAEGGYVLAPPSTNGVGKAYRWIVKPSETAPPPIPPSYLDAIKDKSICIQAKTSNNELQSVTSSYKDVLQEGHRDEDLFHVANLLAKGRMPQHHISQIVEILALNCNPPFSMIEAKKKVESALARLERRDSTVAGDLRDYISVTSGYWRVTEAYNELQLVTKEQKTAARVELLRLLKDKVIQRHPSEHGKYRRIEAEVEAIDWENIDDETVDIKLPFHLEEYVTIMPKNIIIVAGSPNSGKTAFLLNVVDLNQDRHDIHYFSSEMGPLEMQSRLKKFGQPKGYWKFRAYERADKFSDVIRPNALNIIDFMEIHENLYAIGAMLKEVHDKLNKGVAIIAIQKKPGQNVGYGGVFSLEKPRLYIAMDSGALEIVKAKNWRDETCNPNGLKCKFRLAAGCKFFMDSGWYRKEDEK